NPFGLQNLMTEGIISGLRVLLPSNQTGFSIPDVVVTDVPLNPGNSGGPLLNMRGEIIGINTAIAYANQFSELSYSISSNIIKKIVPQLIAHGTYIHPWLGVTGVSLSPDVERGSGLPMNYKGVIISSVQTGSPAAKVNLQPTTVKHMGDIIIAIDGHSVKRFEDIINYLESTKSVGNTIIVKLLRNGTVKNVDIQLTANPLPVNVEENTKTTPLTLGKIAIKDWTKIIGLSDSDVTSQGPRLAASGNNVYAVWEESTDGTNRIIFAKSTDRGNTFSKSANLTSGVGKDSETPSVAAFGNIVYVVWTDNSPGNFDIFFIKITDGGNTFSKPLNLSNDPGLSYLPRITTNGKNNVYVVWTDNSPGNYNILFTRSLDGGASFDKPIILSNLKGVSNFPNIAASGNDTVYVVWSHKNNTDFDPSNTENQTQTYDIFFTKSLDLGHTFSKPVNLSNDPANSQSPAVAVSEMGTVYVVWSDNSIGTYETFFTKSLDLGHTFSKVSVISSNLARSISPSISTYGDNVYVVWSDNTFGNSEIFFTKSLDDGSTFNEASNINEDAGISGVAQITIAPEVGNLYLIWQDNTPGNSVIYFTKARLTALNTS
ncbi:MAG: PDZ domain-containing protein, partial [Candidatus Nitrosopolaris sp.]